MKKYLLPTPEPKQEVVAEDFKLEETKPEEIPTITPIQMPEPQSNCNGNCSCGNSSFSGIDNLKLAEKTSELDKDKIIVYGMFGIVSILALVLISQQIKK